MKLVDEPWETDQIYDTCKKKLSLFTDYVWVKNNFGKKIP